MNISAEEKNRYLREAEVVLAREGFLTDRTNADRLRVLLDGLPLCEVPESGGVTYRMVDISTPERVAAKDRVYSIVRAVAEYMYQMERAPILKVDGLEDSYKVLADFNGVVLAGCPSKYGTQFVTWDRDFDHKGVSHGHYYTGLYASGNYEAAKRDFATRSGLIPEQQVFREEQLVELYRCCTDTLQNDAALSYKREKAIQEVQHGTDADTLERAVGHVVGTSLPVGGSSTHAVLSAHSGMASSKLFSDIDQLAVGDTFYIHVLGDTLAYKADSINTVLPTDTRLLQIEDGKDYVTLVTCTPFGVNTHRLLVRGHRVPYLPEQEATAAEETRAASSWTHHYLTGLAIGLGTVIVAGGAYFLVRRVRHA